MKKALSYFMILSMLVMSLVIPTEVYKAYDANLSVSVSSSSIKIGDTVTVNGNITSGTCSIAFK